jgi:hypothetical protein
MSGYPETTFQLREPITLVGKNTDNPMVYETITLREPKAKEIDQVGRTASTRAGEVIALVALIGKVPMVVAGDLCKRDLEDMSNFFASFTPISQATGETESPS